MTVARLLLPLAALCIAAGCTGDGPGGGPPSATIVTPTTPATAPSTDPTGSAPAVSAPDTAAQASTVPALTTTTAPPSVGEPVVASELIGTFDQPVDLAVRPGDDALWIVEQPGRIVRVDGDTSTVRLDVTSEVNSGGERGLLGLAFSPNGPLAYVNFTDSDDNTVIAEYVIRPDGTFDAASQRVVLEVDQPFGNHNAGDLAFGPDDMLYVPLGDGGSGGDPQRNSSDPNSLLGSMLRIEPAPGDGRPYSVPADNPFADGATFEGIAGAPEVWAWGLRNPWKIAFDPVTHDLWIPDVGQNEFEEINLAASGDGQSAGRGLDFGWSAFEGNKRFNDDVLDPGRTTAPVLTYHHDDGCSISGGAPYRGTAIAELEPAFVYSDFCTGTIWALDLAAERTLTLLDGFSGVTAIRAGPDGELYVLEHSGAVHRFIQG